MRHNRPFDGHEDEWTICFGNVEEGETLEQAAIRETNEEYGIKNIKDVINLDYSIKFFSKNGKTRIHFFAIQIDNIDVRVLLNEESIGYDWVPVNKASELMQHEDEFHALTLIKGI